MRNAQAMTSLYVRLEMTLDTAMREAARASPGKYKTVSEFVRVAIKNQIRRERRGQASKS